MKKSLPVSAIRELDRLCIESLGIPGVVLMDKAGFLCAKEIMTYLESRQLKKVFIFTGLGNNAGDGFVIARYLIDWGIAVEVVLLSEANALSGDAKVFYDVMMKVGVKSLGYDDYRQKYESENVGDHLFVDAIFGTGLSRDIEGVFKSAIEEIKYDANKKGIPVVAIDIPTGLNADSGDLWGCGIHASLTLTLAALKIGFNKNMGPAYCGEVRVLDIGIPQYCYEKVTEEML